ncbi:MAG TPA: helix-turn-helix domain-containing protein [Gammaproteobacteria bacterium]|nr:helix-turn-helix domain-containing protein [Gammaproteobacteria bacterium]
MQTPSLASPSIMMFPDGRFNTKNAALYLGYTEKTLAMMRSEGTGPRFIKRGRVFYYKEDLDQWLNERGRLLSTAQSLQQKNIAR